MSFKLQDGTVIQTLILSKDTFEGVSNAKEWIKENDFVDDKVDETENSFRFRQREPNEFKEDGFGEGEKFRTTEITDGVSAVIGFLKEQSTQMQEVEADGHIHRAGDELTGPAIAVEGGHWHQINEEFTSADRNTPDHTHTLPNGERTGLREQPENNEAGDDIKDRDESLLAGHLDNDKDKDKRNRNFHFCVDFTNIKLNEGDSNTAWIEIMHTISGATHGVFGEIKISKEDIEQYKRNFDDGIRGQELPIDFFHESLKEAAGWIKELDIRGNGDELWALAEFTPKAERMIKEKEIKFFSPNYSEKHLTKKGKVIKNVLLGGGLTNRPFLDLSPIKLSENLMVHVDDNLIEKENEMAEIKKLTEDISKLSTDNKTLSEQLVTSQEETKKLSEKIDSLEKEQEDQNFEGEFSKLLSEGKTLPSLKEKLKDKFSSKELSEFYSEMPAVLSMKAIGSEENPTTKRLDSAEQSIVNQGIFTEEEILKYKTK
ncbi:hypothetical protein LCGC14_0404980 [marine sediment metagenome]|uniref:Phage-like element PBSX protein XkdF domain-containing protein n=1 Tax=marine sediment metagenome TaxID=412755 RepID=A0A0F9T116_9ZZZZ